MEDDEGVLIGTGGYGTYRYSYTEERFVVFDYTDNCQECNSVNSLFQASDESVWIGTFAGALKIKANKITRYDEDELAGNIATTIAEDSWGNIWIGTVQGKTITKISGNLISQVSFNNGATQNFIFGIQEDNEGNLWVGTVANGLFHYDGAIMKQIYQGPPDNTIITLRKDSRGNLWIGTSEGGLAQYITNPL
jgi:ligand-binding sensor domain-containing protein